jgi:hypothetical protein
MIQTLMTVFPSLKEEQAADYVVATVIAILFPIVRYILDKTLYHVRYVEYSTCKISVVIHMSNECCSGWLVLPLEFHLT